MKKVIFLLSLLCSICHFAGAQSKTTDNRPFLVYLHEAFMKNRLCLDTLEVHGFCWVRFSVKANEEIGDVQVTTGIPPVLSSFLKESLLKARGFFTYDKNTDWFILPVKFILQKKGDTKSVMPEPTALDSFLTDVSSNAKSCRYLILPAMDYVSPYDGNNLRKMRLTKPD
ncbi:MAG: hypothetical protein JNM88_19970 [Chitinophagaceae bacterium]|nr:hypothetical protein [Chitinophagaceae bacterium]